MNYLVTKIKRKAVEKFMIARPKAMFLYTFHSFLYKKKRLILLSVHIADNKNCIYKFSPKCLFVIYFYTRLVVSKDIPRIPLLYFCLYIKR